MSCAKARSIIVFGFSVVLLMLGTTVNFRGQAGEDITNDRVIQMAKTGLDDEIIIAKIKTGHPKFSLTDNDIMALKKGGVSGKVIAAMLEASVLTSAVVKIDGKPVELHTLGQAKIGSRLSSASTLGIKKLKEKAYLQGRHASVIVSSNPKIEVELPPNDTIDNYIVVRMDEKGDRRELEVATIGKSGLSAGRVVKTSYEDLGSRHYKVTCHELKNGEFILYVVGSPDTIHGVFGKGYDFTVE